MAETEECMDCNSDYTCLFCSGLPCPICEEDAAYKKDTPNRIQEACAKLHSNIHGAAHEAAVELASEHAEEYIDYYMFFYRKEYVKIYEAGKAAIIEKDAEEQEKVYNARLAKYTGKAVCSYHQESVAWFGERMASGDGLDEGVKATLDYYSVSY